MARKSRSKGRWVYLFTTAVVTSAVGIAFGYVLVGTLVRRSVEVAVADAVGTSSHLRAAALRPISGGLALKGLTIDNPPGFTSNPLAEVRQCNVQSQFTSLLGDSVFVPLLEIDGLELVIEYDQTNRNNLSELFRRIAEHAEVLALIDPESLGGKRLQVDRLVIRNIVAHVHLSTGTANADRFDIVAPLLELEGVTQDNVSGIDLRSLAQRLLAVAFAGLLDHASDEMPAPLLVEMERDLAAMVASQGHGAAWLVVQVNDDLHDYVDGIARDAAKRFFDLLPSIASSDSPKPVERVTQAPFDRFRR